jgi:hypothetical protein
MQTNLLTQAAFLISLHSLLHMDTPSTLWPSLRTFAGLFPLPKMLLLDSPMSYSLDSLSCLPNITYIVRPP